MRYYEAYIDVQSDPDAVWAVLIDAHGLGTWDSGIDRVEGRIAPGERITVHASLTPGRTLPVKVTEFSPPTRMVWSGGMPLGLFRGVRTFTVSQRPNGVSRITVREEYTGALLGMMWRSMPDLGPSFEQFVRGLKKKVEAKS